MTTVATINRLATMAGRYALLSRDLYSNQKTKGWSTISQLKASTEMRKACRLVRLHSTFENESAHFLIYDHPLDNKKCPPPN